MRKVKTYLHITAAAALLLVAFTEVNARQSGDAKDPLGLRSEYLSCSEGSKGVTANILKCDADEYRHQDARLNRAYKQLMSTLSDDQKALLRNEERKWIAYRNSYCSPNKRSGTGTTIESSSCLVAETAKQATALEVRPLQSAPIAAYQGEMIGLRNSYLKCIESHPDEESKNLCAGVETDFQMQRLNRIYDELNHKLNQEEQARLRTRQKIWTDFRDSHCGSRTAFMNSPFQQSRRCIAEETAKQASSLEVLGYQHSSD